MTRLLPRTLHAPTFLLVAFGLSLSACATKPDRDRPPRSEDRPDHSTRSSGTFLQPAALLLSDMDMNQDRVTTRVEMQSGIQSEWESFERNPSATTFANWSRQSLGSIDANPTFMSFDRDFNGVISEDEFTTEIETLFARLDKNSDDKVDRSEMVIAFQAPAGRAQRRGNSQQGGQRGQGGRGGGRPPR